MGVPRLAFALSLVTVLFALDHVSYPEDSSRHLSESYSSSDTSTSSYDSSTDSSYSSSSPPPNLLLLVILSSSSPRSRLPIRSTSPSLTTAPA